MNVTPFSSFPELFVSFLLNVRAVFANSRDGPRKQEAEPQVYGVSLQMSPGARMRMSCLTVAW